MNKINKQNIQLLNLVDYNHSSKTLLRIIKNNFNSLITPDTIFAELGNTPTAMNIVNDLKFLSDDKTFSVNCLYYFDVNYIIIERLQEEGYKTLNELSKDIKTLGIFHFQQQTNEKIISAIKVLEITPSLTIKERILDIISALEPIANNKLKEIVLNEYTNVTVNQFDQILNYLIEQRTVLLQIDGYRMSKPDLKEFLLSVFNEEAKMLYAKVNGKTLEEISIDYRISKQRVQQKLSNYITKLPLFNDEEKYFRILNNYSLNQDDLSLIGLQNTLMINYVKIKYKIKPTKSALDYIEDFDLFNTPLGKSLMKQNKVISISNSIVKSNFIEVFKRFLHINNIFIFDLGKIKDDYNSYLSKLDIDYEELYINDIDDIVLKSRKLEKKDCFLNIFKFEFIFFKPDDFTSDFLNEAEQYLKNFKGYGSVGYFFNNNSELCVKNRINNENVLFAILKGLYAEKFKDKIKFLRNPTIIELNSKREETIERLLLDMDFPCGIDDFLNYVYEQTGLHQQTVYSNYINIINEFKNSDGLLSLENDFSNEDMTFLSNLLKERKCWGYNYLYYKLLNKYDSRIKDLLASSTLKKIGYCKTNTSIYSAEFKSRFEALENELREKDFIISDSEMDKITNSDFVNYKFYEFTDTCNLIRMNNRQYLNVLKMNLCSEFKDFKNSLIELLPEDEIVLLEDFMISESYRQTINNNILIKDVLYAFDEFGIIKFLFKTSNEINYLETDDSLIISKNKLSINILVEDILSEYGSLSFGDLSEILFDRYKILKSFNQNELYEMGYYCPSSSQKVYFNKYYYEKELEEILNGNV